jgi:hypothetical protein
MLSCTFESSSLRTKGASHRLKVIQPPFLGHLFANSLYWIIGHRLMNMSLCFPREAMAVMHLIFAESDAQLSRFLEPKRSSAPIMGFAK